MGWDTSSISLPAQIPTISFQLLVQGTNGGVTRLGLFASVGGGLLVGTAAYLGGLIAPTLAAVPGAFEAARGQWLLLPLGRLMQNKHALDQGSPPGRRSFLLDVSSRVEQGTQGWQPSRV